MKVLHIILTILFWITGGLAIVSMIAVLGSHSDESGAMAAGRVVGNMIGAAILPAIVFVARYFVGKQLKK